MGRFLRDHVIGLLIISAAGSLLATFIAQALPDPAADGTWWRTLLFQPVPAIVSVLYTLILVAASEADFMGVMVQIGAVELPQEESR